MPPSLGHFGDARREKAGIDLLARLVDVGQSGVTVRTLGGDRSGEVRFERFLRSDIPNRRGGLGREHQAIHRPSLDSGATPHWTLVARLGVIPWTLAASTNSK